MNWQGPRQIPDPTPRLDVAFNRAIRNMASVGPNNRMDNVVVIIAVCFELGNYVVLVKMRRKWQ